MGIPPSAYEAPRPIQNTVTAEGVGLYTISFSECASRLRSKCILKKDAASIPNAKSRFLIQKKLFSPKNYALKNFNLEYYSLFDKLTQRVINTIKPFIMDTQTIPQVRARAVVPTMEHVMFNFGKEVYSEVLSQLQPNQQELFRRRMDDSQWLNLSDFVDFNKAIISVVYRGDINSAELLGAEAAEQGLNKFMKFLIKVGDIRFSFKKATSIFVSYYQPARLVVTANEEGYSEARIYDMHDPEGIIGLRIKGFLRRLFELSGHPVKSIELRRNEKEVRIQIHW